MKFYLITVQLSNGQKIKFEKKYPDVRTAKDSITKQTPMMSNDWYSYEDSGGVGFFLKEEVVSIFLEEH